MQPHPAALAVSARQQPAPGAPQHASSSNIQQQGCVAVQRQLLLQLLQALLFLLLVPVLMQMSLHHHQHQQLQQQALLWLWRLLRTRRNPWGQSPCRLALPYRARCYLQQQQQTQVQL